MNLASILSRKLDDGKIQLDDCDRYVQSLETLLFFAENVKVTQSSSFLSFKRQDASVERCASIFSKAAKTYKIKLLKPLKILCLRMLKEKRGFTKIHDLFLQMALAYNFPRYAKEVVEYKALPEFDSFTYSGFLFNCAQIETSLGKYKEATKFLSDILELECHVEKAIDGLRYLKIYMILKRVLGQKPPSKEAIQRLFFSLVPDSVTQIRLRKYDTKIDEEILALCEPYNKPIPENIYEKLIFEDPLAEKLLNINEPVLRAKGVEHSRSSYERIRTDDLDGKNLKEPLVMISLNIPTRVARYDCEKRILQFKDEISNMKVDIDRLVSQSYQMYESLESEQGGEKSEGGSSGMDRIMGSKRGFGRPF